MTEAEAIERLRRGDVDGLRLLVEKYELKATRAAVLVTRDLGLAQEAVQEAFVRVYERIEQFDANRPFEPWFMRIVVNNALKAMRRRGRELSMNGVESDGAGAMADMMPRVAPDVEEQLSRAELRQRVRWALALLTPKQRAAVVLRYYLGMSGAEMATVLGITEGAVKWRLAAARERLRTLLGNERPEVE
ncbi:MAG TPA: RNA polymerase sigma factor [Candidatus Sulfomarinibacteraceae bacterium]|nr:RNA polymerase sigma factor [Candidatus Sulfomarinibacteraceae bacterium]